MSPPTRQTFSKPGLRRFLTVMAAGLCVLAAGGCATIDRGDLTGYVDELHSTAAEGALIAGQAQTGKSPKPFIWIEAAELNHVAGELAQKFADETPGDGLKPRIIQAAQIDESIAKALQALHHEPGDRSAAHADRLALIKGSAEAEKLTEELQK